MGDGQGRMVLYFDLFRGKTIHTTELLESPLEKGIIFCLKSFPIFIWQF